MSIAIFRRDQIDRGIETRLQAQIAESAAQRHGFHDVRETQPSDGDRILLTSAVRELRIFENIVMFLECSDIGRDRIQESIRTITDALNVARTMAGMEQVRRPCF